MPADPQMIGSGQFNAKIRNYLRDFYTYQFKEKGKHFVVRRPRRDNKALREDRPVKTATFDTDARRLRSQLEQAAGVQWTQTGRNSHSRRVECVTVDTRAITENPFLRLYRLCSERTTVPGEQFAFVYLVLLLFLQRRGARVRTNLTPPEDADWAALWDELTFLTVDAEAEARRGNPTSRGAVFQSPQIERFAETAIRRFAAAQDPAWDEIRQYLLASGQEIVFEAGHFRLSPRAPETRIPSSELFSMVNAFLPVERRTFHNKMEDLERMGIVLAEQEDGRTVFSLGTLTMRDLLGDNRELAERFAEMVRFFSETLPLGAIGTFLLDRVPGAGSGWIRYKHNYLQRVLNDYTLIDLLYAIRRRKWLRIEYRNAAADKVMAYQELICFPLEVRESVTDGRHYLVYYHPGYRSVSALRIEFIDSAALCMPEAEIPELAQDLVRARALIACTWGTGFADYTKGNVRIDPVKHAVEILIRWDPAERFLLARTARELRGLGTVAPCRTETHGDCLRVSMRLANPKALRHWLRSYTGRVCSVRVDGEENSDFARDIRSVHEAEAVPFDKRRAAAAPPAEESPPQRALPPFHAETFAPHELLFHELFGDPFRELGALLETLAKSGTVSTDALNAQIRQYRFRGDYAAAERRKKQAEGFCGCFFERRGDAVQSRVIIEEALSNALPLTAPEIQWLGCVLRHPFASAFLAQDEQERLLRRLSAPGLFDLGDVKLHDQFRGLDDFYFRSSRFGANAAEILHALRTRRKLRLRYRSQYGDESEQTCAPAFLEFSERDNRFRMIARTGDGLVKTFNLERILLVRPEPETFDREAVLRSVEEKRARGERRMEIVFYEGGSIPDRILTEFSCFRKRCVKWGTGQYRMTLYYDAEDTLELVVRLLAYGAGIFVFEDTGDVRREMAARIERQIRIQSD